MATYRKGDQILVKAIVTEAKDGMTLIHIEGQATGFRTILSDRLRRV